MKTMYKTDNATDCQHTTNGTQTLWMRLQMYTHGITVINTTM